MARKRRTPAAKPGKPKQGAESDYTLKLDRLMATKMDWISRFLGISIPQYVDSVLRPVVEETYREYERQHNLPPLKE